MKYGILSLNLYQRDNNWGSVLQSWALQNALKDIGVEAYIVNFKPKLMKWNYAKYPFLRVLPYHIRRMDYLLDSKNYYIRDTKFQRFYRDYYEISSLCDKNNIGSLDVDGFVVGSDIVWNEDFWEGIEDAYFCAYEGMKKENNMAYGPSMSRNGFSDVIENMLPKLLDNFKYLSVRETEKQSYIQKFSKYNVETVLDPTLLYGCEKYENITSERMIKEKYVLVYCVVLNEKLVEYASDYAKKKNLKLASIKCCPGGKRKIKDAIIFDSAGVEEWLSLIKYAEVIFTSSFHACVFSILFKKEFYAVYNSFGSEKIVSLMNKLEINNHCFDRDEYLYVPDSIDYEKTYKLMDMHRKKSYDFLSNLKGMGEN
ncbi:MAG: polysaccharide pyruvyl transferase family protein [Lachnospiraceae bacterium]|nr:polysaccharide pyruvyl transferase family protein [Lachnospiraceae bacterium]